MVPEIIDGKVRSLIAVSRNIKKRKKVKEQYTDRIFEVFKRIHAIGEYQGAGVGLAIVKEL